MNTQIYILFIAFCGTHSGGSVELIARFDQQDVKGSIHFNQTSESSNVTVKLDLALPKNHGNLAWEIKQYPVPYSPDCSGTVGSTLNNLHNDHGFLKETGFYTDSKIKVIGKSSILGRSLVIYKENAGGQFVVAVACAVILPMSSVKYAKAAISSNLIAGSFEFLQNGNGETVIFGEMSHSDGTTDATNNLWYIYEGPPSSYPDCKNVTTLFNPTSQNGVCTSAQEVTCKIGDLSSKFGNISVGDGGKTMFFGIDKKLPLSGSNSILNRILVVYGDNKIIGCGAVKLGGPLLVEAKFKSSDNKGVSGSVGFMQESPYHATKLLVDLKGLSNRTSGYHVHLFPISIPEDPCSPASVSGHLNPYNVVIGDSPSPNNGTVDKYEMGDLSGKFGSLDNQDSYNLTKHDHNLPLYGMHTSIGRSVVIHFVNGSRLTCADITPVDIKDQLGGVLNFSRYGVKGTVQMKQFIQGNDIHSPTLFVVDLKKDNGQRTSKHNFHIHIKPLGVDATPCSSVSGHYNPIGVNVRELPYSPQCNQMHPYRCEIGDTSKKTSTYDIGGGKKFYADIDTPLFGKFTSLGRSIVFHAENKGAARLTCANIVPDATSNALKLEFDVVDWSLRNEHERLRDSIAEVLDIPSADAWKINSLETSNSTVKDDCFHVTFYVLGKDKNTYKEKFNKMLQDPTKLNHYKKCEKTVPSGSSSTISSFLTIVTVAIVYWFC